MTSTSNAQREPGPHDRQAGEPAGRIQAGDVVWMLGPAVAPVVAGLTLGRDSFTTWIGVAAGVVVLAASLWVLRRRPVLATASILLWLTVERFAVAAMSPVLLPESLRALLTYKEFAFPLLLAVGLPRTVSAIRSAPTPLRVVDGLAVAFCLLIVVGVALSPAPLMERLVYARRLAILPVVYLSVRLLPWQRTDTRPLIRLVVAAGFLAALFGLIERFAGESLVWRQAIPAAYYYHLSTLADLTARGTDFPYLGLPVTFWDFTSGVPERRLVSTFLEATTLAAFLAISTLLAIAALPRSALGLVVIAVTGVATLLTLSKAGWAILVTGLLYLGMTAVLPRLRTARWLMSMAAGVIGALIVVSIVLEASGATTGAMAHFAGLKEGIESVLSAPLGHGVGIGGNFGVTDAGAESTFGVILVQVGALGLILWGVWLLGVSIVTGMYGGRSGGSVRYTSAVSAALIAFFATAALTESAGGLLGNWLYPFVAGGLVTSELHETGSTNGT